MSMKFLNGADLNGQRLTGLGTPTAATDAATKAYVDSLGGGNPTDLGYDIVLLLGQSNMQGDSGGTVQANLDVVDGRIWMFGATGTYASQVVQGSDPLPHRGGSSVIGPGMEFARWYLGTVPTNRRVLLVPAAYNGTAFLSGTPRWDPTTSWPNDSANLYNLAITQAQAALFAAGANSRIVAAAWVQGESDVLAGATAAAYRTAFEYLIDGLRSRLALPNLPFVIGSMTPEFVTANGSAATAIDGVHVATPTRKPYTSFVRGPAGYGRGDNLHYSPAGQRVQGRQLVGGYLTALGNASPSSAVPANPPTPPAAATAPGAPTGLTAVPSSSQVALSWTAPASTGGAAITDYVVQYSADAGSTWTTFSDGVTTSTSAIVTGLINGTQYVFRVAAVNGAGTSSYSATASATPAVTATTAADTFTRANSTTSMGATESGSKTWVPLIGTWGILSNQAYAAGGASASLSLIDLGSANHTIEAKLGALGDSGTALIFRGTDADNWQGLYFTSSTAFTMLNRVGGTTSVFSPTGTTTYSLGDLLKISVSGTAGTVYRNGAQVATFTASQAGTRVGFRSDSAGSTFDNLTASAP